jgi:sugar phosphate isomerase/epimerase
MIPDELLSAYRSTRYTVGESPVGAFVLRVGERSALVDRLCRRLGRDAWAYITACNPRSQVLTPAENERRMAQLTSLLDARRLPYFFGAGMGEDADWAPEPSLLVLGADRELALELGRRFEQYAVVYGVLGEPAQLLPCEGDTDST